MTFLSLLLTGCSAQSPESFAGGSPVFDPNQFFQGQLVAEGMFFDRWNKVRRTFHLDLFGEQKDGKLHLHENLTYDDGEKLKRIYVIEQLDEHNYQATSTSGLVGPAKIEAHGNVLRWKYTLRQKIGDSEWDLNFDDWMYLLSEDSMLNRAYASKFGLRVGEVFMMVRKLPKESE